MVDSFILSDPPRVKLSFGANLDGSRIKEGQDVLFRCDVEANPKAYKIGWKHQVSQAGSNLAILNSNYKPRKTFQQLNY